MITGSTGIGKSYIASAIGNQACMLGYKVLYANTAKLFSRLKMAKSDGSYIKEIGKIEKQELLILDDCGLQPMDNQMRSVLMEITVPVGENAANFEAEIFGKDLQGTTKSLGKVLLSK